MIVCEGRGASRPFRLGSGWPGPAPSPGFFVPRHLPTWPNARSQPPGGGRSQRTISRLCRHRPSAESGFPENESGFPENEEPCLGVPGGRSRCGAGRSRCGTRRSRCGAGDSGCGAGDSETGLPVRSGALEPRFHLVLADPGCPPGGADGASVTQVQPGVSGVRPRPAVKRHWVIT